jgi:hypothetical protein
LGLLERLRASQKPTLIALAKAIEKFEGYAPGTRSYINNNPGNLRWSPYQTGQLAGFSKFATYQDGFDALVYQLTLARDGRSVNYQPRFTLYEFFETYAPTADDNHPKIYAEFVAKTLGVPPTTTIGSFI